MFRLRGLLLAFHAVCIIASPTILEPKVTLDHGTFTGVSNIITHKFLGIPFAKPPYVHSSIHRYFFHITVHSSVGDLRYNLPQPIPPYVGNYDATKFGLACPQQAITIPAVPGLASPVVDFIANSIYGQVVPDSEDCKSNPRVRFQLQILTTSIRSHPERDKTCACWTKFEVACGRGKDLSDLVKAMYSILLQWIFGGSLFNKEMA